MADQEGRKPSQQLPQVVRPREERDGLPTAIPIGRKQTPIAMPAPPAGSHDDPASIRAIEEAERQRAQLLVELQEAKEKLDAAEEGKRQLARENERLQRAAPVHIFPPPSVAPPKPASKPPVKIEEGPLTHRRHSLSPRLMHLATGVGIFVAIAWNAFNSSRIAPEKIEDLRAQQQQSRVIREDEEVRRALADRRNLAALRAIRCWGQQLRGASQRQGLDLPSLPGGGVTPLRLAEENPNRPGPPKFIAKEVCPQFPDLPPEISQP